MTTARAILFVTTAVVAVSGAPQLANAQSERTQASRLDEVVVTARRTSERLQDVPIPVSAVNSAELDQRGLTSLTGLTSAVPGLFFNNFSSNRNDRGYNQLVFRGLKLGDPDGTSGSSTLFIDGAPVISGSVEGVSDIERVEVLRGPQGVVFGRATMTGAINVVTKDPSLDRWGGRLSGEAGGSSRYEFVGSVNGPVVQDKLGLRLSVRRFQEDGQYKNNANPGQRLGDRQTTSISATVLARPTESLRAKFFGSYWEDDDGTPANAAFLQPQFNCDPGAGRGRLVYYCGALPDPYPQARIGLNDQVDAFTRGRVLNNSQFSLLGPGFLDHAGLRREAYHAHLEVSYDLPGVTVSSLTAMDKSKWAALVDADNIDSRAFPNPSAAINPGRPFINNFFLNEARYEDLSQEVRLESNREGRFRWIAGANYVLEKAVAFNLLADAPTGFAYFGASGRTRSQTVSAFGGVYFDLTSALTLSAEVRRQKIEKRTLNPPTPLLNATFEATLPRLSVNYNLTPDVSVYALYSQGARPGGFNGRLTGFPPATVALIRAATGGDVSYEQEKLDNYEVGMKAAFLDGRGFVTIGAYSSVLRDQQITTLAQVPNPAIPGTLLGVSAVGNGGRTKLYGIEAEGRLQVTPALQVQGAFSWNHTDIRSYVCVACASSITGSTSVTGNALPGSPEYTGNLSATYRGSLGNDINWFARGDYLYQSRIFADETNVAWIRAAHRLNFRVGANRGPYSAEAYLTNSLDARSYQNVSRASDALALAPSALIVPLPERRRFGVKIGYSF